MNIICFFRTLNKDGNVEDNKVVASFNDDMKIDKHTIHEVGMINPKSDFIFLVQKESTSTAQGKLSIKISRYLFFRFRSYWVGVVERNRFSLMANP